MLNYILNYDSIIIIKKTLKSEKKMTQAYEEVMEMKTLEVEEIEEPKVKGSKESEVDELLGDLNPRYFEEGYSFDEAQQKIFASKGYASNYRLF